MHMHMMSKHFISEHLSHSARSAHVGASRMNTNRDGIICEPFTSSSDSELECIFQGRTVAATRTYVMLCVYDSNSWRPRNELQQKRTKKDEDFSGNNPHLHMLGSGIRAGSL
jgi:hypothetical protein